MKLQCIVLACLGTLVAAQMPGGPQLGPVGGPFGPGPIGFGPGGIGGIGGAGIGAGQFGQQQQQVASGNSGYGYGGSLANIVNAAMQTAGNGIGTFQQGMGQVGINGQQFGFPQQQQQQQFAGGQQFAQAGGVGGYSYQPAQPIGNVGQNFGGVGGASASPFFIQAVGEDQQLAFTQVAAAPQQQQTWMPDFSSIQRIPVGLGGMASAQQMGGQQQQQQVQQQQIQHVAPLGSNSPPIGSIAWMQQNLTPDVVTSAINWTPQGQIVGPQVTQGPPQLQAGVPQYNPTTIVTNANVPNMVAAAAGVNVPPQQPQQNIQPVQRQQFASAAAPQQQQQHVQAAQMPTQQPIQQTQPMQQQIQPNNNDVFQQIAHPAQLSPQQLQQLITSQIGQLNMNQQQAQSAYLQAQAQAQMQTQQQVQQQALQSLTPIPPSPQALIAANLNNLGQPAGVAANGPLGNNAFTTQQAVSSGGLPWGMPAFGASRGLPQQHSAGSGSTMPQLAGRVVSSGGGSGSNIPLLSQSQSPSQPQMPQVQAPHQQQQRMAAIPPSAVQPVLMPGQARSML